MTSFDKVQKGVAAYLDAEVMPAFKNDGWKRVLVGTAIGMALNKSANYIPVLQENAMVKTLGLIDEQGNVDVESVVPVLKDQLSKEPMVVTIPMLGDLTFGPADVDRLYEYIRAAR